MRNSQSHYRTHSACTDHTVTPEHTIHAKLTVTPEHISYDAEASTGCVSSHPRAADAQALTDTVHRDVSVTETRSFCSWLPPSSFEGTKLLNCGHYKRIQSQSPFHGPQRWFWCWGEGKNLCKCRETSSSRQPSHLESELPSYPITINISLII